MVVSDKFDSFAIATFNITSDPPDTADLTPDAVDELLNSAIGDKLQSGDAGAATSALIVIADTVLGSNETSGEACVKVALAMMAAVTEQPQSPLI